MAKGALRTDAMKERPRLATRDVTGQPARVPDGGAEGLSAGEIEVLIDGLSDDISFHWALIHLGLRANPPADEMPPSAEMVSAAFVHFERLLDRGLVKLGHIAYVDSDERPGTVAPVKHVEETVAEVRKRVEDACSTASDWSDWAFSCWLVSTEAGAALARQALRERA